MKILWVTRSVADYRVPVFKALAELTGGDFRLVYSRQRSPQRVNCKIEESLGEAAIGLKGEWRLKMGNGVNAMANRWLLFTYQPGIIKLAKRHNPDVLIADGFFQWTAPTLWMRMRWSIPLVICYERTLYTEKNVQWYRRLYRRTALRYTDAMCCNGRLCAEYAASLGMAPSRITVPNMTADTEGLSRQASAVTQQRREQIRQEWKASGPVFIYVGQFIPRKGLQYLLEAWAILESDAIGGTLVLVGQGYEENSLREQARRLGLNNVRFMGVVDYDQLAQYYASADVFVIPTLEDNWSLVVPEAMACGLPILCSKYNGCWPELVQAGRNGWVFDPYDGDDLVRCLKIAAGAGERLKSMGEQSMQIVSDHTPAHAARAILRACEIAVRRQTGRREDTA
jgi:glycosyltransferase involved in cell wall biosynthesis